MHQPHAKLWQLPIIVLVATIATLRLTIWDHEPTSVICLTAHEGVEGRQQLSELREHMVRQPWQTSAVRPSNSLRETGLSRVANVKFVDHQARPLPGVAYAFQDDSPISIHRTLEARERILAGAEGPSSPFDALWVLGEHSTANLDGEATITYNGSMLRVQARLDDSIGETTITGTQEHSQVTVCVSSKDNLAISVCDNEGKSAKNIPVFAVALDNKGGVIGRLPLGKTDESGRLLAIMLAKRFAMLSRSPSEVQDGYLELDISGFDRTKVFSNGVMLLSATTLRIPSALFKTRMVVTGPNEQLLALSGLISICPIDGSRTKTCTEVQFSNGNSSEAYFVRNQRYKAVARDIDGRLGDTFLDITDASANATTTLPSKEHTLIIGNATNVSFDSMRVQYVSHPRGVQTANVVCNPDGSFSVLTRGLLAGESIVLVDEKTDNAYFAVIPNLTTQLWNLGNITFGTCHLICAGRVVDDNNSPLSGSYVGVSGSSDANATAFVRHAGNRFYVYGEVDGNTVNGVVIAPGFARTDFECVVGSNDLTVFVKKPSQATVIVALPSSCVRELLWASLKDESGRSQCAERRTVNSDGSASFHWNAIVPGFHEIAITSVRPAGVIRRFGGYELKPGPNNLSLCLADHDVIGGRFSIRSRNGDNDQLERLYITLERERNDNIFPECAALHPGDKYLASPEYARCVVFGSRVRGQCVKLSSFSTEIVVDSPNECCVRLSDEPELSADIPLIIKPVENAYLRNRSMPIVSISANELVVRHSLLNDLLGPERLGARMLTYMPCDYRLETSNGTVVPNTITYSNPPKSVTVFHE